MSDYALTYPGGSLDLPLTSAAEGPSGLGIGKLLSETGHVTSTRVSSTPPACTSAITFIDGDAGILRYRGYPIEELAEQALVP